MSRFGRYNVVYKQTQQSKMYTKIRKIIFHIKLSKKKDSIGLNSNDLIDWYLKLWCCQNLLSKLQMHYRSLLLLCSLKNILCAWKRKFITQIHHWTRIPVEKDARNTGFYNKNLKQNFHQSTPSPFKNYHIEMDRFFPSVDHYNEQFW